jgi:hypothetical protein
MKNPNGTTSLAPFAFAGKELQRLEIDGDIWYFAEELRDLLGAKNIKKQIANLPDAWKRVIDARNSSVAKSYLKGNPRRTIINTKAVIKTALRANWEHADAFAEQISDIAERYYKGDLSLAGEVVERNGGKDQEGLERLAVQTSMFMGHDAMQRTMRRFEGIEARKGFTSMLGRHSVTPVGFGYCTNKIYAGTLGGKAKEVAKKMGLPAKANLRDHLPAVDLIGITLAEALATERIEKVDAQGDHQCASVCEIASDEVGQAIRRTRA